MKITLLAVGKTDEKYLQEGIAKYLNRLKHYIRFELIELADLKNTRSLSEEQQKQLEGERILKQVAQTDQLILLDETGKQFSSEKFSGWINKKMLGSVGHLVFVIGGPYGFSEEVRKRSAEAISLSEMTFSHQMIRLFFTEQLYRAFTILRGEPYHHA
ncbi:MAG: 23S rRNA (pseudouridine(1915)-N(3))-methyltransferase RlmH [Mucilaginibacter polytrichastri]|nr:23S rRNA (pseudouridine(1915)-N(3))-methyltransferase RlmH [Mucilaginibacter polytrichastri]